MVIKLHAEAELRRKQDEQVQLAQRQRTDYITTQVITAINNQRTHSSNRSNGQPVNNTADSLSRNQQSLTYTSSRSNIKSHIAMLTAYLVNDDTTDEHKFVGRLAVNQIRNQRTIRSSSSPTSVAQNLPEETPPHELIGLSPADSRSNSPTRLTTDPTTVTTHISYQPPSTNQRTITFSFHL